MGRVNHVDGYGNASETNRRTDAWRMEHDSGGGLATDLADKRGRSGRKDRAVRQEIRIPSEALSNRQLRHLRQMAALSSARKRDVAISEKRRFWSREAPPGFVSLTTPGGSSGGKSSRRQLEQ